MVQQNETRRCGGKGIRRKKGLGERSYSGDRLVIKQMKIRGQGGRERKIKNEEEAATG